MQVLVGSLMSFRASTGLQQDQLSFQTQAGDVWFHWQKKEQGGLESNFHWCQQKGIIHMQVYKNGFNNIFREFQLLMKQTQVRRSVSKWAQSK